MATRLSERERVEVVIAELKALRDSKFEGNLTALARALDMTSAYLSNVVNGHRGIGLALVDGIARVKGCSIAEVLHEQEPRWHEVAGWDRALTAARAQMPMVGDDAWEWLGSLSGPLPSGLDPGALGLMALAWSQAQMKGPQSPAATSATTSPSASTTTPTTTRARRAG